MLLPLFFNFLIYFFTRGSAEWFTVHSLQLQTLTWASNVLGGTSEISLPSLLRLSTSPWGIRWWRRECGRIFNCLHKSWDVSEMLSLLQIRPFLRERYSGAFWPRCLPLARTAEERASYYPFAASATAICQVAVELLFTPAERPFNLGGVWASYFLSLQGVCV